MAPTLGYWKIRGLAQPIRLLLAYTKTDYNDKLYICGPPPDFDTSQWTNEKFKLGLDFPNLPYYIDGDIKITQSLAILRHLARKYKLDGANDKEKARVDVLEQQLVDNNMAIGRISYDPNFETLKVDYLKTLPNTIELLSKFLGERKYFAGDSITFVDFMAYELIDKWIFLEPKSIDKFENLKQLKNRIESLPQISKYLASNQFKEIRTAFNGDMAMFGSRLNK